VARVSDRAAALSSGVSEDKDAATVSGFREGMRLGVAMQTAASLLWVGQAGFISLAVAGMAAGETALAVLPHAAGVLVVGVARSMIDAYGVRLCFRQARSRLSHERRQAVDALLRRSPLDPERPSSGAAASAVAEQAEAVVPYLARYRPARLRAMVVPTVLLACVMSLSWVAALVLLFAAPLSPMFMALVGWRAKAASESQLVELGGMNAFLLDRLRGLATIRAMDAVDRTATRLRQNAESLRARTMAVLRIAFLSSAVLELFAALGVAMVAVYVGFHLLGQLPFGAWGEKLTLGEGLFILLLAPAFFEPLRDLSTVWHDKAAGEAALKAMGSFGTTGAAHPADILPGAPGRQQASRRATSEAASVRIDGLGFRHAAGGAAVFRGFDLAVAAGEHVALFAPSGAGKSTLLALMAGLARPERGQIVIDGEVLSDRSVARLRRRMAWMGQTPFLLAGTLAANVGLGRRTVNAECVRGTLDGAGLGEMAGPATIAIGEGGVGLSGGEASRVALARVMATSEAGLILADEPTAHLDTGTSADITDALLAFAVGRTLIVATHDPALAARMDRIVHLTPPVEVRDEPAVA
jgi:ATP-binding cassette subfamily C protein CydD